MNLAMEELVNDILKMGKWNTGEENMEKQCKKSTAREKWVKGVNRKWSRKGKKMTCRGLEKGLEDNDLKHKKEWKREIKQNIQDLSDGEWLIEIEKPFVRVDLEIHMCSVPESEM